MEVSEELERGKRMMNEETSTVRFRREADSEGESTRVSKWKNCKNPNPMMKKALSKPQICYANRLIYFFLRFKEKLINK